MRKSARNAARGNAVIITRAEPLVSVIRPAHAKQRRAEGISGGFCIWPGIRGWCPCPKHLHCAWENSNKSFPHNHKTAGRFSKIQAPLLFLEKAAYLFQARQAAI